MRYVANVNFSSVLVFPFLRNTRVSLPIMPPKKRVLLNSKETDESNKSRKTSKKRSPNNSPTSSVTCSAKWATGHYSPYSRDRCQHAVAVGNSCIICKSIYCNDDLKCIMLADVGPAYVCLRHHEALKAFGYDSPQLEKRIIQDLRLVDWEGAPLELKKKSFSNVGFKKPDPLPATSIKDILTNDVNKYGDVCDDSNESSDSSGDGREGSGSGDDSGNRSDGSEDSSSNHWSNCLTPHCPTLLSLDGGYEPCQRCDDSDYCNSCLDNHVYPDRQYCLPCVSKVNVKF
jgi:hypothetical protein